MKSPLVLMMALSLPSTASAVGLGDIHVDSALNEPLAADIDIVGATPEDLAGLTASIANKETFVHLNAERPSFLQSATFKVSQDSRGRPVLAIRSTESFSEPLVDLVVDLRWHNGELIRQYSLLLDPADFPTAARFAGSEQPRVVSSVATAHTAEVTAAPRKLSQVKIGAKATLRGVAWRVGARSEADLQTLMYAIFIRNPDAFDGNINRLRRGAVLNIPPAAEVAAVSKADASREIHAQMAAWHSGTATSNALPSPRSFEAPATSQIGAPVVANGTPAGAPIGDSVPAALNLRMQLLERNLRDMQVLFDHEHERMLDLQARLAYAQQNPAVPTAGRSSPIAAHRSFAGPIAAGLALIGAVSTYFNWLRRRRQRVVPQFDSEMQSVAEPIAQPGAASSADDAQDAHVVASVPIASGAIDELRKHVEDDSDTGRSFTSRILDDIDIASLESSYIEEATGVLESIDATAKLETSDQKDVDLNAALEADAEVNLENTLIEDTVNLHHESSTMPAATLIVPLSPMAKAPTAQDPAAATVHVDTTRLDYNLVDLDITAQHVQMPSLLHEPAVFKERRKNLVDVLKMAIEREPDRRDLRMKLLETYYAAAAVNRQGFLDAVQKFARERDYLANGEWEKIAFMGRQIAGDTALFAEPVDKEDLADCA